MNLNIEQLRREKGITQKDFAERLGVTQGAVSQWEKGFSRPSIDKLSQIVNILGCNIDDLFSSKAEA